MRNLLIIYALLIGYILLSNFVLSPASLPLYNELINPLIWVMICGAAIFLSKDASVRIKDENGKTQSLIIGLIIYFIIYFLLGLLFGYQNTPYSKDIFSILKNIWAFGSIIFFQEIIREAMVKLEKKKIYNFVIITILLALINISFTDIAENFDNAKEAFIYTAKVLIPTFVTSGVMTYFVLIGGARLSIIYRLFLTLPELIVPIIPNFDWFVTAVIGVTVPLALFVYLNFEHV